MIPEMSEVERWVLTHTTVRWVCGGGRDAGFAYTAGYWAVGLPELVVVGLSAQQSTVILNTYGARQYERGSGWEPGDIDTDLFTMPTKFGHVDRRWMDANMGLALSRHDPDGVVQVLWPDTAGRFPGEPGFDPRFKDQKVLA